MFPPLYIKSHVRERPDLLLNFMSGKEEAVVEVYDATKPGWIEKQFSSPLQAFSFAKKTIAVLFDTVLTLRYENRKPLPDLQKSKINPDSVEFDKAGGTWAKIVYKSIHGRPLQIITEEFGYFDALGRRIDFMKEFT